MAKPQRFCVYCGGAGLTHEHIFGDWLKHELDLNLPSYEQAHRIIAANEDDHRETVKKIGGDPRSRRPKNVCKTCNESWMRKVMEAALPTLRQLVHGNQVNLSVIAQRAIATWAAMATMTGEFTDLTAIAISQAQRTLMYEQRRVPPGWRIWIGSFERESSRLYWHHFAARIQKDTKDILSTAIVTRHPANSQSTTLVLGRFYITLLSSETPLVVRSWKFALNLRPYLTEIWPLQRRRIRYPPKRIMGDELAEAISDSFPKWAAHRFSQS